MVDMVDTNIKAMEVVTKDEAADILADEFDVDPGDLVYLGTWNLGKREYVLHLFNIQSPGHPINNDTISHEVFRIPVGQTSSLDNNHQEIRLAQ